MKVLKRNQLIVLVISLMLITAGYLNFTANNENIVTSTIADRSDEAIGDAELVSTIPKVEEENIVEEKKDEEPKEETIKTQNLDNSLENTIETDAIIKQNNETNDYYFTTSKLERNNMYSESLEAYQKIYNNSNATVDSKNDALSQINYINNTRNSIMIAENLIIAKGFEDVVVFVNDKSVSVVIKAQELKQEEVAQIQNIVSRELNVEAEIIHISNKA